MVAYVRGIVCLFIYVVIRRCLYTRIGVIVVVYISEGKEAIPVIWGGVCAVV